MTALMQRLLLTFLLILSANTLSALHLPRFADYKTAVANNCLTVKIIADAIYELASYRNKSKKEYFELKGKYRSEKEEFDFQQLTEICLRIKEILTKLEQERTKLITIEIAKAEHTEELQRLQRLEQEDRYCIGKTPQKAISEYRQGTCVARAASEESNSSFGASSADTSFDEAAPPIANEAYDSTEYADLYTGLPDIY